MNTLVNESRVTPICVAAALILTLAGCPSSPQVSISQQALDRIGQCNAGFSTSTSVELNAKIEPLVMNPEGKVAVKVERELRGALINTSDKITVDNINSIYTLYVQCLSNHNSLDEQIDIVGDRVEKNIKTLNRTGYEVEASELRELFKKWESKQRAHKFAAAHNHFHNMYKVLITVLLKDDQFNGLGDLELMVPSRPTVDFSGNEISPKPVASFKICVATLETLSDFSFSHNINSMCESVSHNPFGFDN